MELHFFLVFLAGLGSFLSPCVLPLVPSYLSFLAGSAGSALGGTGSSVQISEQGKQSHSQAGPSARVFLGPTLGFIAGFTLVFVLLGLVTAGVGGAILNNPLVIELVSLAAGTFLIILGLHLSFGLFTFFYREIRVHPGVQAGSTGILRSLGVGAAFGAGWTPCIGPMLAGVLTLAASTGQAARGALYLGVYSLGLGVPFLLSAVFFSRFKGITDSIKPYMPVIQKISGFILGAFGILVALGRFGQFTGWILGLGLSLGDWTSQNPEASQVAFTLLYVALGSLPLVRGKNRWAGWKVGLAGLFAVFAILEITGFLQTGAWAALWLQFEGF